MNTKMRLNLIRSDGFDKGSAFLGMVLHK